jgi:hypothetical protein
MKDIEENTDDSELSSDDIEIFANIKTLTTKALPVSPAPSANNINR